ncbi:molecular chaperone [Klebsiella pasteurii]|uniref:fimbrial biogenesis chaperone n=1 Tax=Klebsiella pasteurii TaxID=2587529 RepID=UPI001168A30A|nr:molecular chaperone [Klebsiella pasteurii]VUS85512.1 Chaperone protein PapD [Klebsiella pasteurii]VUS87151.1 Chaperone protein PapD [Klebsiella pasteurii]
MKKNKITIITSFFILTFSFQSIAALKLDRTRIIYSENNSSVSLEIKNENKDSPYLAQSWLEDKDGRMLENYIAAVPPLVRVNPDEKLVVRLEKLSDASSLPKDRETLFYYVLREIPPKAEEKNTLQLALQTKIKLFYRPASLGVKKSNKDFYQGIKILKSNESFKINNTTPYYVVMLAVVDLSVKKVMKNIKPITLAPFQMVSVNINSAIPGRLGLLFIDDFGGRPLVNYNCSASCNFEKISDQ